MPTIVQATITTATATPGGTIAHHAPTEIASRSNAFSIRSPHEVRFGSPSPRNAIAVSAKIANATISTVFATSSGAICGTTCRTIVRGCEAPSARVRSHVRRSRTLLT